MRSLKYLQTLVAVGYLLHLVFAPGHAWAAKSFSVSMDTAPLSGLLGPYYIEFQFNDGDGANNNNVVVSDFGFGSSGGATGAASFVGGATGSLNDKVLLADTDFINEFIQEFVPGNILTFVVSTSENSMGPVPDQFSFAILDEHLFELPTSGPGSEFLSIDLSGPLMIASYGGLGLPGSPFIAAPEVLYISEPTMTYLWALSLCLLLLMGAKQQHGLGGAARGNRRALKRFEP